MKIFTVTNLARVLLLMSAAVLAVGLVGCQGDDEGGGGDLVGDWTPYSSSYDGEIRYANEDAYYKYQKQILSFRASGKFEFIWFIKIGNVWVEMPPSWPGGAPGTYRISGSMIYVKYPYEEEGEGVQYRVSGNYLTIIEYDHEIDEDGVTVNTHCYEQTFKRVNLAEFRRSLGTVYTNDPKLSYSASYKVLVWYLQDDESEFIGFDRTFIHGGSRYTGDDYTHYYTNGNKLVLVNEDCEWDDDEELHCTVLGTYQLTYKITGSGRDMQLSINGDIWLPMEYDDYFNDDYYNRYSYKRPVRRNTGKSFFAPFAAP